LVYLYESAGECDGLVGTVDHFAPETDELAAAVGRPVQGCIEADWAGSARTQHAPV